MAVATQVAVAGKRTNLLVSWHLLSLDAPTVAVLWTWFLAHVDHVALPASSLFAMGLAVWMLYAADRLLDARVLDTRRARELEERHLFHFQYRSRFLVGICAAAVGLAVLLPQLSHAAIELYLVEGSLLFAWFLILHATGSAHRLPKEIAVGLFFAAATFIPTVARRPELRSELLAPAALFAGLCSLNCLYIYRWEHPLRQGEGACHPSTRLALRHLSAIGAGLAVGSALLAVGYFFSGRESWSVPAACALATLLLRILDRFRRSLGATTLRAAADLALLTPLLFVPFRVAGIW